jgi:hypothetical protein
VLTCSASEYLDAASGTCAKCDSSCASCNAAGSGKCLSCPSTSVLKAGSCVPSKCDIMTPYGVCLQDLAISQSRSTLEQPSKSKVKLPTWVYIVIVVLACFSSCSCSGGCELFGREWTRRKVSRRSEACSASCTGRKNLLRLKSLQNQSVCSSPIIPTRVFLDPLHHLRMTSLPRLSVVICTSHRCLWHPVLQFIPSHVVQSLNFGCKSPKIIQCLRTTIAPLA